MIDKPKRANRLHTSAAAAALAVSLVGSAEGLKLHAYADPATRGAPWTICYGHTGDDVSPQMAASLAQCKTLLLADLDREADGIEKCFHGPMTDGRFVAFLSLAHNIGVAGVCRSSVARKFNAGDVAGACDALLNFNRAAGFVMRGLTLRRQKERELCLFH
jgi:lysozyme